MKKLISLMVVVGLCSCSLFKEKERKFSSVQEQKIQTSDLALYKKFQKPQVGGHQGTSFSLRPNTLAAFAKAHKNGASVIELDVRLSKDGIPMIGHDPELWKISSCRGNFSDKFSYEIKKCHAYLSSETIPSFEDVLNWSNGEVAIYVDLKEPLAIASLVHLVQQYNAYDWVFFRCHHTNNERYKILKELDPKIPILVSANNDEELNQILATEDPYVVFIDIDWKTLEQNPDFIKKIHASGKLVAHDVWYFNSKSPFSIFKTEEILKANCEKSFTAGIDLVMTNRPKSCTRQLYKFLDRES